MQEVELAEAIDGLAQMMRSARGGNSATISIQAGGVGVWIAVSAALLMLVMFMAMAMTSYRESAARDAEISELRADVRELRGENQTMRDYLSAIYMMAPSLKPDVKAEE